MREILSIHVGKTGNYVGEQYWNLIAQEHNFNPNGTVKDSNVTVNDYKEVLFNELSNGHYTPRAILLDTEPTVIDSIYTHSTMSTIPPDNVIYGRNGTGNCWGKGYNSESQEIIPFAMDTIRKEIERCDSFQGFQFFHSISGGTGGGLCSAVQIKLKEIYSNTIFSNYTLIPPYTNESTPLEMYNSTLSMKNLIDNSNMVVMYDNTSMGYLCEKKLNLKKYSFDEINKLMAMGISDITSTSRFHSENSASLRKIAINLVEYQYHHFFLMTNSQLNSRYNTLNQKPSTIDIIKDLTNFEYTTCLFDLKHSKDKKRWLGLFCLAFFFRGNCCYSEIIDYYKQFTNSHLFYVAVPCHSSCYISNAPPIGVASCGTALSHNQSIGRIFQLSTYNLRKSKAFLSYYTKEGISKEEIEDADRVINEYRSTYDNYGGPQMFDKGDDWENTGKRLYTAKEEVAIQEMYEEFLEEQDG